MFSMNRLTTDQRVRLVRALVEGCSVRATARLVGVSLNTVLKFIPEFGAACQRFHDERVRGLGAVERVQADEVWCFCNSKAKNVPADRVNDPDWGSVWTWTALCADTKLMIAWHAGNRDADCALEFMLDLAGRVTNRIQLTTDGHWAYRSAVKEAFGGFIDYAQLIKHYREPREGESRYSPCECVGITKVGVIGNSIGSDVSTSFVERANLTLRMGNRRYTRLTNAFSRKLANLRASIAIHYCYYNFCRVHQTLRCTPAQRAEITDHIWEIEELVAVLEAQEKAIIGTAANKRGPYRKRSKVSN